MVKKRLNMSFIVIIKLSNDRSILNSVYVKQLLHTGRQSFYLKLNQIILIA